MPATSRTPSSGLDRFFAALHAAPVRRVRQGKVVAGTAAGVARYFGVDPIVVRVAFVVVTVLTNIGITSYLLAWFLLPDDEDTVLAQQAVRQRRAGAITLGVFALLSIFSTDDSGGWAQSLVTAVVIATAGVFFWRRRGRRRGMDPTTPPPAPTITSHASDGSHGSRGSAGPGAAQHGSPARGGFSRFDPVTGRWVPATPDPTHSPTPAMPSPSPGSAAPAGHPIDRLDAPAHPMTAGRAATWSAPQPPPVSAGAGAAEAGGSELSGTPRPRVTWWLSTLVLLLAAATGIGAGLAVPGVVAQARPGLVGAASALVVVAIALLVAGIAGRSARALVVAVLLLLPIATGVVGLEVTAPPDLSIRLVVGAPGMTP